MEPRVKTYLSRSEKIMNMCGVQRITPEDSTATESHERVLEWLETSESPAPTLSGSENILMNEIFGNASQEKYYSLMICVMEPWLPEYANRSSLELTGMSEDLLPPVAEVLRNIFSASIVPQLVKTDASGTFCVNVTVEFRAAGQPRPAEDTLNEFRKHGCLGRLSVMIDKYTVQIIDKYYNLTIRVMKSWRPEYANRSSEEFTRMSEDLLPPVAEMLKNIFSASPSS